MAVPSLARRGPSIPSAEVWTLRRPWLVTTVARLSLALALAGLLVWAFVDARRLEQRPAAFTAKGTSAIVVLDLSQSVTDPTYRRIANTLSKVAGSGGSIGLVAFSDVAYELFPPGSPPEEVKPLVRYFRPVPGVNASVFGVPYPRNPWNSVFSGGTAISTGLELAHAMIKRDNVDRPSILLLSDLDTSASDQAQLTRTLANLRVERTPVRVVPLFPTPDDREFFAELVGEENMVTPSRLAALTKRKTEGRLEGQNPKTLALLAGLLVLSLALNEWWCRRLDVPGAHA
jgi:VWA domain-containing protein